MTISMGIKVNILIREKILLLCFLKFQQLYDFEKYQMPAPINVCDIKVISFSIHLKVFPLFRGWQVVFKKVFLFNWSVVDFQCCVNFCSTVQWFSYPCTCSWQPCLSASGLDHLTVPSARKWRGSNPLSYLRERLLSMASELLQCINNNAPHPHMLPGSPVQETYWSLHPTVSEVLLFLLTFQCGGSLPPCSLDGRFRSEWKVVVPCPWRDPRSPFREDSRPLQVSCGDWHRFHQGWNPSLAVLPWDLPVPLAFRKWACVCYSVSSALLGGTAGYRYWQDKPFFPLLLFSASACVPRCSLAGDMTVHCDQLYGAHVRPSQQMRVVSVSFTFSHFKLPVFVCPAYSSLLNWRPVCCLLFLSRV